MKWIFLAFLMALTPILALTLRKNPGYLPRAALILGILPFLESGFNVSASPISWPTWPGMSKGIEVSLTDAVAIAILFATHRMKCPLALKVTFAVYVLGFIISTLLSENRMPSFFYGWQVFRSVILFYAVARASATDPKVPPALLTGLVIGLVTQGVLVSIEFAGGKLQSGGWFGHQNLLGMITHFVVYPAFALFLAGYRVKSTALAVLAALLVAFAGASRATIGLMAAGLVLTIVLSCYQRMSGRKMAVGIAALIGLAAVSPLLYSAVERRSSATREGSSEERRRMMSAASMIIADHPQGVGANRYVLTTNVGGFSGRAGIAWTSSAAPVHNTYYLVAAEMGWIGLLGLVSFLLAAIAKAFQAMRRARGTFLGEYATGLAVTFIMVAIHSYFEWIAMLYFVHILMAMSLGIVVVGARKPIAKPVKSRPVATHSEQMATAG